MKDGTAQGVAKVRHWESLLPPEQRLYTDPYAYACFPGSIIQQWMGPSLVEKIYRWMGGGGFSEMISVRTKWFDEQIEEAVFRKDKPAQQLIILGAGYDTRVDQPEVQQQKLKNLLWLSNKKNEDGKRVADRMGTTKVQFLSVNFNEDDLEKKLTSHEGFKPSTCSVVTMEGVSQYIPKESTADTLTKLKRVVSSGSTILITYVDEKCMGDKESLSKQHRLIRTLAEKVGEPWISGWTPDEFAKFMKDLGYEVLSDTTQGDYNETYLKEVGRQLPEEDLLNMERFVVAKVL
eukprot:scaffold79666_cov76-Cyclotella_meneghiniana.AAC.5